MLAVTVDQLAYQTSKTVHVQAKHYKHYEDERTGLGVCGSGFVPLSTRGTSLRELEYTHTHTHMFDKVL